MDPFTWERRSSDDLRHLRSEICLQVRSEKWDVSTGDPQSHKVSMVGQHWSCSSAPPEQERSDEEDLKTRPTSSVVTGQSGSPRDNKYLIFLFTSVTTHSQSYLWLETTLSPCWHFAKLRKHLWNKGRISVKVSRPRYEIAHSYGMSVDI